MSTHPALIVFSDLDGTLLDHDTYSWEAARPALEALRRRNIPLILASSKTAQEIAPLREEMGFSHCPAIVENGAGLLPENNTLDTETTTSGDYADIIAALNRITPSMRTLYEGFNDLDDAGVAHLTGLSVSGARAAKARQFSEPGIFSGTPFERARFIAELAEQGVSVTQGGRFLTLSKGATKADQIATIKARLAPQARSIALGDAPNDLAMLGACDIGVIIPNPAQADNLDMKTQAFQRAPCEGPEGWAKFMLDHLEHLTD
ncbi:HAD-IIB family hydrolase [Albirhodobacter sp. R86504]|uniref:HAD-IIB family hydrolase n=1 Tax=Albirhodobacter sp. R86504 TaxID=3093848 RepID=UPI003673207A